MNKACGDNDVGTRREALPPKKYSSDTRTLQETDRQVKRGALLRTVLLGCTGMRLTGAESDTNVKQTLISVFV